MADETLSGTEGDEDREEEQERTSERPATGRPAAPREPREGHATPFWVYKPGQGSRVRWGTAIGALVIAIGGVSFAYEYLRLPFGDNLAARTLIPVALLAVVGWVVFWLVAQKRGTVDFMIATEGEMKKVNWSSRKEVLGATKVVIFTVLAMGAILACVDLIFIKFFQFINVLKIGDVSKMVGSGGG
jgi:preprotein translocase SecE subunit